MCRKCYNRETRKSSVQTEIQKLRKKEYQKKYRQTESYKKYRSNWEKTEKGKLSKKRRDERHNKNEKRKSFFVSEEYKQKDYYIVKLINDRFKINRNTIKLHPELIKQYKQELNIKRLIITKKIQKL